MLKKKPEIYELYGMLKAKNISFKTFCAGLQVSRNTGYSYIKILEENEKR